MNDLSFDTVGLFRRELRDVRAVVANIDHRTRKLIAHKEKRTPEAIAKQHFAADRDLAHLIELKAAVTPAMTTVKPAAAD